MYAYKTIRKSSKNKNYSICASKFNLKAFHSNQRSRKCYSYVFGKLHLQATNTLEYYQKETQSILKYILLLFSLYTILNIDSFLTACLFTLKCKVQLWWSSNSSNYFNAIVKYFLLLANSIVFTTWSLFSCSRQITLDVYL